MMARWWAFSVWALVAASAAAWGLKLFVGSPAAPPQTQVIAPSAALRGDLTRVFGADAPAALAEAPPEPAASSRFQLVGVIAPRAGHGAGQGLALIAVDGKPARAYRIGAAVEGETVLQSVRARGASLGPRGGLATVALEMAPLPAAASGTLPAPDSSGNPGGNPGAAPPARPGLPNRPPPTMPQRLPFNNTSQTMLPATQAAMQPPPMPIAPGIVQPPAQPLQLMPQGIEPGTLDTPSGAR